MFTDDYVEFKRHIKAEAVPAIGRLLAPKIRPLIQDMFGGPEITALAAINAFFTEVQRKTGDWTRGESEEYYNDLIKKWASVKNKSLIISTYYYLHTTRAGQNLAEAVDRSIFADKTFLEHTGHSVPGGFHLPTHTSVPLSPHPINIETLKLVTELAAHKREGFESASVELLTSIAEKYGENHTGKSSAAIKAYLLEKIEEWRRLRGRVAALAALGDAGPILNRARSALDNGDFSAAEDLLLSSEQAIDPELNKYIESKCEHLSLRADVALLANDQITAAALYDQASSFIYPFDPAKAIRFSHLAANGLHRRSYRTRDIRKIDVAKRYRDIMDRMRSIPTIGDWQRIGPVVSYCGILGKIGSESGSEEDIAYAETECRAVLAEYEHNDHQLIPAIIRSVLAGIIVREAGRGTSASRLKEAIELHEIALQVLTPSTDLELWRDGQMRYGLALMEVAKQSQATENYFRAISSFEVLLESTSRADHPERWSRANHNIGVCYRLIGIKNRKSEEIDAAIRRLREALLERSENNEPVLYARTKSVIALCYEDLYRMQGGQRNLALAIACLRDTLRAWNPAEQKTDWHHFALRLVQALRDEARIFDRPQSLENAIHLARYIKQYFKTDPARGGAHYPLIERMALLNPKIPDDNTRRKYLDITDGMRINL